MGHDHSHSHAHSHSPEMQLPPIRKTLNILLITLLTTVVPTLIKKQQITRTNAAVSLLVATSLFLFDDCKKSVQGIFEKLRNLKNGIVKHTPFGSVKDSSLSFTYRNMIDYVFRNDNAADRVTIVGAVVNILLSIAKFSVGVTCRSSALIADAGHSLSDLFSDFITLWACQVARLPPDDDHPYGHGKFEAIGSLFLAMTLFATGISVGVASNAALLNVLAIQRSANAGAAAATIAAQVPTSPALLCAAVSILSKEWLFRITRRVGERLNSPIVTANAWHHRSDAFSSILALVSIGLAMFVPSLVAADSIAGILVAGMICTTGVDILGQSLNQLSDSNNAELVSRVTKLTNQMDDVVDIKRIRARQVGSKALVDVAVTTPDSLSSSATRTIEEVLRYRIMAQESDMVFDADVHATSSTIVCPALLAINGHEQTQHIENNITTMNDIAPSSPPIANQLLSTSQIDEYVRKTLTSSTISTNDRDKICDVIKSIEQVTAHYHDTLLIDVDVTIRLQHCHKVTIERVNLIANTVRKLLEDTDEIHKANIYLDLNECDNKDGDEDCPIPKQTMEFA